MMEMWYEVKSYGNYTAEEVWQMTLPYFQMTYHFAMKSKKLQAQMIAASMVGGMF
jgi:hypothetical protein